MGKTDPSQKKLKKNLCDASDHATFAGSQNPCGFQLSNLINHLDKIEKK